MGVDREFVLNSDDVEVETRDDGPNLRAMNEVAVLARARKEQLTTPWLVSTFVMAIYSPVVLAVAGEGRPSLPLGATLAFVVLALALGVFSVFWPPTRLADEVLLEHMRERLEPTEWAARMRFDSAQTADYKRLPESEQRALALSLAFERPYFVALIATAAIALLGFVHGLAAKSFDGVWPFVIAAFALNGWHYPRLTSLIDRGRKLHRTAEEAAEVQATLRAATRGRSPARARSDRK